jgi:hypothetical protein
MSLCLHKRERDKKNEGKLLVDRVQRTMCGIKANENKVEINLI